MKPEREISVELSPLEEKVYTMLVSFKEERGQTLGNRTIAKELGLSRNRVGRIRKSINNKLSIPSGS